jgi:hypothetical protein
MPSVIAIQTFPAFPTTPKEAREIAEQVSTQLIQTWVDEDLPIPETYYFLVCGPGQLSQEGDDIKAVHMLDQGEAMAAQRGGAAVQVILTDNPTGVEEFVAYSLLSRR